MKQAKRPRAKAHLLDTDILSNLLKRLPSMALIAKLASVLPEHQFTSSITLGELTYGAHRLQAGTVNYRLEMRQKLQVKIEPLFHWLALGR